MQLVFATNNENKIREINQLLGDVFKLMSPVDFRITDDIPENEPTLEGNALTKARYIYDRIYQPVFADDTGLEIDALDGLPGVLSARFAGDSKDSSANIEKVLSLMSSAELRTARFRTVIALIIDRHEYLFEGVVEGSIIRERRGREGFGYDPIFVPEGEGRTFAEMPLPEKNLISHRAMAFGKLKEFLDNYSHPDNK